LEPFERVRSKMSGRRSLRLHAKHLAARAVERAVPPELLADFDPAQWELMTAEVRTDTGRFVNSAWRRTVSGQMWWLVIGLHDTVETAYPGSKRGDGPDVVASGVLFDRVREANAKLLEAR
jgi:hypothetical protein